MSPFGLEETTQAQQGSEDRQKPVAASTIRAHWGAPGLEHHYI